MRKIITTIILILGMGFNLGFAEETQLGRKVERNSTKIRRLLDRVEDLEIQIESFKEMETRLEKVESKLANGNHNTGVKKKYHVCKMKDSWRVFYSELQSSKFMAKKEVMDRCLKEQSYFTCKNMKKTCEEEMI